ncbi:MAG TPA: hypothetical protein VN947_08230 [Polyangia bacterium]|nr:hypothetical protein [Polyangia bacterium]
MIEVGDPEKTFSFSDEDDLYDPVEFDPETSSVDDEIDSDTLAFRDAVRDIVAAEGHFEVVLPR